MILYRYFATHAYETLQEAKLKTSLISAFNDPFEFLFRISNPLTSQNALERMAQVIDRIGVKDLRISGFASKNELINHFKSHPEKIQAFVEGYTVDHEKTMQERKGVIDAIYRVVCFSGQEVTPLGEILLWSHYAHKHNGVRIGFEFPEGGRLPFQIIKIKYQNERVEVDMGRIFDSTFLATAMSESSKVKSNAWNYECEYRLLANPQLCEARVVENRPAEWFMGIRREWVRSVDFGVRCPDGEVSKLCDLLKTNYAHVNPRRAQFHKSDYALDYHSV